MTNFEISIRFFLQLAGVLLGPSLLGRLAPGWQAYLFPKQTMTVLYGKQRDALLATAGRKELTIASALESSRLFRRGPDTGSRERVFHFAAQRVDRTSGGRARGRDFAGAVEIGQRAPQIAPGTAHLRPEVPRTDVLGRMK